MTVVKIPRFWSPVREESFAHAGAADAGDPLGAFGSEFRDLESDAAETAGGYRASAAPTRPHTAIRLLLWTMALAASALLGATAMRFYVRAPGSPSTGQVTVETIPAGLPIFAGAGVVGTTPAQLSLPPGDHLLHIGAEGAPRRALRVFVTAGGSSLHHLEIGPASGAASMAGRLEIQTEPSGLPVTVDDLDRGVSPITLENVVPGDHLVSVRNGGRSIRRSVRVEPGATASLLLSAFTLPAAAPGWLKVDSPEILQLKEHGSVIGSSDAARLMLPAGSHRIELVSDVLGYAATRRIVVAPGELVTLSVELPLGAMSINALPWAEVWIDGERMGETPLANLPRPIGTHEIVFKHPELGERRQSVMVTLSQPARVGVNMRETSR